MATKRMISSDIWEDDFFTALKMAERLIWIGVITACADDQGRLQDNANLINSKLFPMDDADKTVMEHAINKFVRAGRLYRYTVNGKKLLQVTNWWKHQTPRWAGKSNYPPPEGWIDRTRFHSTGRKIVETSWNTKGGFDNDYIVTSTCEDVNVNVNDDVNVNVNDDVDVYDDNDIPLTPYKPLEEAYCKATGTYIPVGGGTQTKKWVDSFLKINEIPGVLPSDITEALAILAEKDYQVVGPSSIINTVRGIVNKRNIKKNNNGNIATPKSRTILHADGTLETIEEGRL